MEEEIWKPIPGYEGHYEASSRGRIRSVERVVLSKRVNASGQPIQERRKSIIRKTRHSIHGYLLVNLSVNGFRQTVSVHPLVCAAFHGPKPGPKHAVAHANGVRDDCRADNLRWDTYSNNLADRRKHGTDPRGDRQGAAKLTWDIVNAIRKSDESSKVLAERYGVYPGHIGKIRRNEKWVV